MKKPTQSQKTEQLNLDGMGKLYIAVLEQTEIWRDGTGFVWKLEEMKPSHRDHVPGFLLRKGPMLRWKWMEMKVQRHNVRVPMVIGQDLITGEVFESRELYPLFSDNGGNLDNAFDEWMGYEFERPLEEWLEERPLVKRIRELQTP